MHSDTTVAGMCVSSVTGGRNETNAGWACEYTFDAKSDGNGGPPSRIDQAPWHDTLPFNDGIHA